MKRAFLLLPFIPLPVNAQSPFVHQISGSWQAYKIEKSPNSLIISYKCTKEGFSAETPLGEKYQAKFDGEFVQVEDSPNHGRS